MVSQAELLQALNGHDLDYAVGLSNVKRAYVLSICSGTKTAEQRGIRLVK